ncbi:hypothetical protein C0V97_03795 [Asaia sp. W19]|uniref:Hint domain-containing protein n=1 Tax=unclassified Asaia TaxID=2685023 RepID=UPI000F8E7AB5|nr:Hint domain-containing protein [Asaia sp. W19]RUT26944.1 hypothetical protein C0V97_03795 [Asaia sp. W19]
MPNQIFSDGVYTLSGTYFTVSGGSAQIKQGDPENIVSATVNGWSLTFASKNAPGVTVRWDYDYSWGNPDIGIIILGDTHGAYHVLVMGDQVVDWNALSIQYTGQGASTGSQNYFTLSYGGKQYSLTQDGTGTAPISFTPCYLRGSMVRTDRGLIDVAELKPGTSVLVKSGELEIASPVIWVGMSMVRVREHAPTDMSGFPIVISQNALGAGIPFKDMRITAEHCIYLKGHFIPARMLVNGNSIFYDKSEISFPVYHFMTSRHGIVSVDGVWSETYLPDDKNVWKFHEQHGGSPVVAPAQGWETDAAAPLCCERAFVEPIWRELNAIAGAPPMNLKTPVTSISEEPDLRLSTKNTTIEPSERHGHEYVFRVPAGEQVWIDSRRSRPCDVVGPFLDDRRDLGVLVSGIRVSDPATNSITELDFLEEGLDGWHLSDNAGLRWTNGHAVLPLARSTSADWLDIRISVAATVAYQNLSRN